ncbi:hypothetical protein EP7_000107 [Isosphaeraceae bacterium EP7]
MQPSRRRRPALGLALVALMAGATPPGPAPVDPFEAVDLDFRALYAGGRAATLARLGPLIIVDQDRLILVRDGSRTEANVIPLHYHRLKAVCHVPLSLYVALAPHGDAPIDADRVTNLRTFRNHIQTAAHAVDTAGFTEDQRARSRRLLDMSLTFLDDTLAAGNHDPAALKRLTRATGPLVLAHAADAARAQIDAYHAQVKLWRKQIPADDWFRLRVLVMGRALPRKHNTAVQFFAKLLGTPGESRRLVYAEQLEGEARSVDLLAAHLLDSDLGAAFFDDPERMELDLLGNAAASYLDTLDLD